MISFYSFTLIFFLIVFLFEAILLNRALKQIPLRIIVNGTRGKSTTVRLLYESFRLNGKTVYAKITGDQPEILYPDGSIKRIKRFSPASIIENVYILWRAARQKPDAFIMECMALQPETQHFLANYIFRPHYTIITNILPDHGEVMGTTMLSVAQTIGKCLHPGTTVLLKKNDLELFRQAAINMSQYHLLDNLDPPVRCKNIPNSIINESWNIIHFTTLFFEINEAHSIDIFKRIWQKADSKIFLKLNNNKTKIYNLFSVNDALSTDKFLASLNNSSDKIFILNCRKDRPLRTKSFIELLSEKYFDVPVWLTGDGAYLAQRLFSKKKYAKDKIEINSFINIIDRIYIGFNEDTSVICLGNHRGTDRFIEELHSLQNSTLKGA